MSTATATKIDGSTVKKTDVEQAIDLLTEKYDLQDATARLKSLLSDAGYKMAANVERLVESYRTKRDNQGGEAFTAATAGKTAKAIYEEIVGEAPAAPAPAQAEETAESGSDETPAKTAETDAPAQDAASAQAATRTRKGADSDPADDFQPTGMGDLQIADATKVDKALKVASKEKIRSLSQVLTAVREAESLALAQGAAIDAAREAIRLAEAGDHDAAAAVEIAQTGAFKTSGLTAVEMDDEDVDVVDMRLEKASGGKIESYADLRDALTRAETAADARGQTLRALRRELKSKAPAPSLKAAAGGPAEADAPELDCELVMRKASEIFTDSFGASSPILEFEVPTLDWQGEPHPDVPAVDDTFRFYAPVLATVLFSIAKGKIPHLMGETGCGKSEFYAQVAARLGFPFVRINMDSHLTRADVVGQMKLVADEQGRQVTRFVDGLVPYALKMPCILLIDELDLGDPEIMPVLQPVLEGKGLRLLEDGGRYVKPHEFSFIGCTGNTNLLGDDKQVYLNAHAQSGATRDRIAFYVQMPYLPEDKELEVVMARVPEADQTFAENMIKLANKTRESYRMGEMLQLISTRHVQDAVAHHAHFAPLYGDDIEAVHDTLEKVVLNFMDDASHQVAKGLIDGIWS